MLRCAFFALGAASLLSCASATPEPVPACARSTTPPAPTRECMAEAESYMQRAAGALAEALMDEDAAPGAARVRLVLDDDARVASSCVHESFSTTTRRRLPAALARASAVEGAPTCLAGRRVEFGWQNTELTPAFIHVAARQCRSDLSTDKGRIHFCYQAQNCSADHIQSLWGTLDGDFRACMLREIPLAVRFDSGDSLEHFMPATPEPDGERAIAALKTCPASPDPAAGRACMAEHGYVPLP